MVDNQKDFYRDTVKPVIDRQTKDKNLYYNIGRPEI
jgi:hypothetical protein